jgi:prevent-host-death family protein
MRLSEQIKPISFLKAHAAEIIRNFEDNGDPLIITQNGEAKVIIQSIKSYEEAQETMALLKILALGNRQIEEGKVVSATDAIKHLRRKKESI